MTLDVIMPHNTQVVSFKDISTHIDGACLKSNETKEFPVLTVSNNNGIVTFMHNQNHLTFNQESVLKSYIGNIEQMGVLIRSYSIQFTYNSESIIYTVIKTKLENTIWIDNTAKSISDLCNFELVVL